MIHGPTFALHVTWTCYGTWLPGDERGHVSDVIFPDGGFDPKQNVVGTPISAGDDFTRRNAQSLQKGQTVRLTLAQALRAAEALVAAARERGWHILRAALMANHIHVVICDCPDDGPAVRRVLKGVSQSKLSKAEGRSQRWWTAGGSDRYKHGHAAIDAAVDYVARQAYKFAEIVEMRVRAFAKRGLG
jgi:REP element-mobilizing transposase RayT